jgi:diaminopimelate epimerase
VDFEKWQALGNDYLIIERDVLPFQLTEARIRAICAPHTGVSSDGILLLEPTPGTDHVARLRIFNPDGSEAELSGNGAREAFMYLRQRGWTDADTFAIATLAGTIRTTITSERTCRVEMAQARVTSDDYPSGADDGRGELTAAEHTWSFQHVQVGNPQCAIAVTDVEALAALDLSAIGPAIEHHALFPNRTNVSWFTELEPGRVRARIFERGVGETAASGTGATGAAVAYTLTGGRSPVTVVLDGGELEVEVDADLHINLSGWAVPVYRGTLADDFVKELHETQ